MKRTNQMQHGTPSPSRLRQRPVCGACLASSVAKAMKDKREADLSGRQCRAQASSRRTSASSVESLSSNSATRSDGVGEYWSVVIQKPVFCGLSLELCARPVINNKTVLPKAAVTAWKTKPRLNLGVASAALRDARQRYLWKGEW